ncbi:NAD(P)-binding protein [Thozetella sp. PMI_491]|nr:NAD(P)-binding protein [Thozetella sp. PMI_491]
MAPLSGKVALITGASKGIGKAVAQRLAADGASVVINYNSDSASADALVASIGADRALAVQADVSKVSEVTRLVDAAVEKFGKIDIVMPNAGLMKLKVLDDVNEEDFDAHFNINVRGPLFLVQKAVRHMPAGGRVIFVSTGVNSFSLVQPNYVLYAGTKGAIDQFTRLLSKDYAKKGITVNAIAPGPTSSELFLNGKTEQVLNFIKAQNPFGKIGEPADQANVVAFLASEQSSWMSGQIVRVNGGTMV